METNDAPRHVDRLRRAIVAARDLLAPARAARWEAFAKTSSTHHMARNEGSPPFETLTEETGVAVRTSRNGRFGFAAASGIDQAAARKAVESALAGGLPFPRDPLPPERLLGLAEVPAAPRPTPRGWASHATGELRDALRARSGGRLAVLRLEVQEGSYSWILTTSGGFVGSHSGSSCSILVEVGDRDGDGGVWHEWLWLPEPECFVAEETAGNVVDRALLRGPAGEPRAGVHDVLLHSETSAHLLAQLAPLFIATPGRPDPLTSLIDRQGRLASPVLTLVDDRSGTAGPLVAPCDGEGLPARTLTLLEEGVPRHRVASFLDAVLCDETPRGGAVRLSYRDAPASGLANLTVAIDAALPPARLLAESDRLLYLVRPVGPIEVSAELDSLRLVASALSVDRGRIEAWHPVVELRGSLGSFLRRIDAVGTDRRWYQTSCGYVGAPSILIRRQPLGTGARGG